MESTKTKKIVRDYLLIIAGTGLLAMSIQSLFDPIGMVTGGFTGIAIIVKSATEGVINGGVPLWLTNILLNVPVFLIALFVKGKEFIGKTLVATMLLSVWLYFLPVFDLAEGDYVLTAVFGGVLCGAGIGLVLSAQATTGGTDMVAVLLQKKLFAHYSVAQVMQVLDALIVVTGILIFGIKAGLYAIVAIYIATQVTDALTEGTKFCRVAYIITEKKDEVAQRIMHDLERGVTGINAKGMYSQEQKCMLYCVVSKKEVVRLKEMVAEIDPAAFIIVTDAREVRGEGFIEENL